MAPLDAKSAFEVVHHLLRRLFNAGNDDGHCSLIQYLHSGASSVVILGNSDSTAFPIMQGD